MTVRGKYATMSTMGKTVKLYHISRATPKEIEDIRENGLSPKRWNTCVGGQKEGFYFFTRELWAKQWVDRCMKADGPSGYMCSTVVPKADICFPNWRADLFFNQSIVDKLPAALKKLYASRADKNGFVPLKLESSTAGSDECDGDWFFSEKKVHIDGLKFQGGSCSVLFRHTWLNPNNIQESVRLSSAMDREFLGLADTLVEHLCERDKDFLSYYNKKIMQNINNGFHFGAVKCVVSKNIPVSVRPFDLRDEKMYFYGFAILANLIALNSELKEIPVHKRIGQEVRDFLSIFRD